MTAWKSRMDIIVRLTHRPCLLEGLDIESAASNPADVWRALGGEEEPEGGHHHDDERDPAQAAE